MEASRHCDVGSGPTTQQPVKAIQIVQSTEEADALVKRVKQLERENKSLTDVLTKVCDENAKLSGTVAEMQVRCETYSTNIFSETPVLKALYERDKFKLFGSSKTATPENLQKLLDNLCKEFTDFRAQHTSSNGEVQKLLMEVQQGHANVQKLSAVVRDQQEVISRSPLAVTVRIAQDEDESKNVMLMDLRSEVDRHRIREDELRDQLQRLQAELQAKTAELTQQQWELQASREGCDSASVAEQKQQELHDKITRYEQELEDLRENLATESSMHKDVEAENRALTEKLRELEDRIRQNESCSAEAKLTAPSYDVDTLLTASMNEPKSCKNCEDAQHQHEAAMEKISILESRLAQVTEENGKLTDLSSAMKEEATYFAATKEHDEERLRGLEAQCETLTSDISNLRVERDQLSRDYEEAQSELDRARMQAEKIPQFETSVAELQREVSTLRERLSCAEESEKALLKAREEIAQLEEAQRQNTGSDTEARCTALEFSLQAVKVQLGETQADLQRVGSERASLQDTVDNQRQTLKSREDEVAALVKESAELRVEVCRLMEENNKLCGQNTTLEGQLNELQLRMEELEANSLVFNDLRSEVDRHRIREDELRDQLQRLQAELQAKTAELTQQQWELQASREGCDSASVAEQKQQELHDKITRYEQELEDLRENLATESSMHKDVEAENRALTEKLRELEDRIRQNESCSAEAKLTAPSYDVDTLLTASMNEPKSCKNCEDAQHQHEAAMEKISILESRLAQVTEENGKLTDLSSAMKEEATYFAATKEHDEERLRGLEAQCETLTSDISNLRVERDQLSRDYEEAQSELDRARMQAEKIPQFETSVAELQREVSTLRERLSCAEESEKALLKAREEIAQLEEAQRQNTGSDTEARCTALEFSLQAVKVQLGETQADLQRVGSERASLQDTVDNQRQTLKSREDEVAALVKESAELRVEVCRLMEENNKLCGQNTTLEGQLNELQLRMEEVMRQCGGANDTKGVGACVEQKTSVGGVECERAVASEGTVAAQLESNSFVPDDIRSVMVENTRLVSENQQMVSDIDRLTSELLVYRQTIDELEAENEEQMRQNEQIRSAHSAELGLIAERLASETAMCTNTNEKMAKLTDEYRALELERNKYQCLVEEKSNQEEKLLSTIVATSSELEAVKEELRRVMVTVNDQLEAVRHEKELEMEVRIAEERQRYENESGRLCAQLHQVEEERLHIESELDKLRQSTEAAGGVAARASSAAAEDSDVAALRVQVDQLRVTLKEAHWQLEEQERSSAEVNERFEEERKKLDDDAAAMRRRIEQLEEKLQTARAEQIVSGAVTLPVRRKKKKQPNTDLLSLVRFDDGPAVDVLAHGADSPSYRSVGNEREAESLAAQLKESNDKLSVLQEENGKLKESIADLTEKLRMMQDYTTNDLERQVEELQEKIQQLEQQLESAAEPVASILPVDEKTVNGDEADKKLRLLTTENKRLRSKLRQAREALRKKEGGDDASVEQLKAELQMLAGEVVPMKNKLAEYMAMADRIGIQYPFSEEMEKAALLNLNAVQTKKSHKKSRNSATKIEIGADEKDRGSSGHTKKRTSSKKIKDRHSHTVAEVSEDLR
ncbi:hypothetical protein, conserved [Trypanosoma brucei gambiense DAL972]|uniref:Uncharacterized protein n=1 Tax=Trypanosoma brucei gambiense (strain MHOM/CI/86/DAL972) TaxID=679716 RepID=C9ZX17_TRYB9|nr:hypothetical protein, conserved [Trypanosoma brucei gambiense DAL972]CBH13958.1 hypothetical protein, conserved [Trypanosoma brucei gambiense DAL972]|eukprot:XP_011776232.1 hypothetical protein, conserved [Trypanosoma brucei gambiense DAL972]